MGYTSLVPTVDPDKLPECWESASPNIGDDNDRPNTVTDALSRQPLSQTNPSQSEPKMGAFQSPPHIDEARMAREDLSKILRPRRSSGIGYKDAGLDSMFRGRLEDMVMFLWAYINPQSVDNKKWVAASLRTVSNVERAPSYARQLRRWARNFIADREVLPQNPYGGWNESLIDADETLVQDIHLHLQGVGKFVKSMDLVDFLNTPEMRERTGLTKQIHLTTAQRWMRKLDYRWQRDPKGQFVDGHEREDVVNYRQKVFLPSWSDIKAKTRDWSQVNQPNPPQSPPGERHTVVWFHDESTFYANDRRLSRWVHGDETAKPYAKGEGASQMVADLVSADYGWLRSPDGKEEARVLFKAGKNREGYFTNDDILNQANKAMDILEKYYPDEDHVLVFDNASTHQKRPDGALSARRMPKRTSMVEKNWCVEVNVRGNNGQPVYGPDGKISKHKVKMVDATFADGTSQSLYFDASHEKAGLFKGMAVILEERGLVKESQLRAECKKFQCPKPSGSDGMAQCCCRRVLYNQPDFTEVESLLEMTCKARSFEVLFLPKFHCELNFIEQCWGFAKRIYRHFPASSKEADLENNILTALESVPLENMRRCGIKFDFNDLHLPNFISTDSPLARADLWMHMRGD